MTKTQFARIVNEILNEVDCKLTKLEYNEDNICKASYKGITEWCEGYFYVPYKFMNRARLRLRIMYELGLLIPVDTETL